MDINSARGARRRLVLLLLALLLYGDAATTHRGLNAEAPELQWANATAIADAKADDDDLLPLGTSWENETDPVYASMAKRMAAAGVTYGYAREWLSWRCPRREKNAGTLTLLPRITRHCYARVLRSLEKEALLCSRPPPEESKEEEARRRNG